MKFSFGGRSGRRLAFRLGLVPQLFHAFAGQIGEALAFPDSGGFHRLESLLEFAVRASQRNFWVHAQKARDVDSNKKQIADFLFEMRRRGLGFRLRRGSRSQRCCDFALLLVELVKDSGEILPIEPNVLCAACQLIRLQYRWKRARDTAED